MYLINYLIKCLLFVFMDKMCVFLSTFVIIKSKIKGISDI